MQQARARPPQCEESSAREFRWGCIRSRRLVVPLIVLDVHPERSTVRTTPESRQQVAVEARVVKINLVVAAGLVLAELAESTERLAADLVVEAVIEHDAHLVAVRNERLRERTWRHALQKLALPHRIDAVPVVEDREVAGQGAE